MSISIGVTGLAGWKIVQRIEPQQIEAVARDPIVLRATTYFQENIGRAGQAEDLVKDYRLMSTALSAFGLEGDIANKAFIQKILESDVADESSLVNRLADKRYLRLAEAFGYGAPKPPADASAVVDADAAADAELARTVSNAFVQREFERRIGMSDENLRLALNARREVQRLGGRDSSDRTLWFEIIGNTPLRKVFQGAFGFPESYGQLPVDRQLEEYTRASERVLGSARFKEIATTEGIDKLVQAFMVRSQLTAMPTTNRYTAALALLTGN
ncbi:DUF1217 domain-containing protein [Paracoccus nototheniae]|uniref:DUF1217 domain-containing protein n=1 Tax=Paracoccus nototheniae TaxID=2489002 RepID=A0ABW4DQ86_9RHOB|nr:DUF1217 domain-containing protein [Paracoccus nototheniae]